MRSRWLDPDFRNEAKTDHRCCVCGKAMALGRPFRTVLTSIEDGALFYCAIWPADYNEAPASAVALPIGNDCAARLGLEWTAAPSKGGA